MPPMSRSDVAGHAGPTNSNAPPLIALTALDIPAYDANADPVRHADLKARFDRLARPQAGFSAYHPVPRLVFARDPALGAELAARIFRTGSDGDPQRWTITVPEAHPRAACARTANSSAGVTSRPASSVSAFVAALARQTECRGR
jgi:hypothetical protein